MFDFDTLPPSLRRVVELTAQGEKNGRIAIALETTEGFIKNSLVMIFDRVGCDSRLQLALLYLEWKQRRDAYRLAAEFQRLLDTPGGVQWHGECDA